MGSPVVWGPQVYSPQFSLICTFCSIEPVQIVLTNNDRIGVLFLDNHGPTAEKRVFSSTVKNTPSVNGVLLCFVLTNTTLGNVSSTHLASFSEPHRLSNLRVNATNRLTKKIQIERVPFLNLYYCSSEFRSIPIHTAHNILLQKDIFPFTKILSSPIEICTNFDC